MDDRPLTGGAVVLIPGLLMPPGGMILLAARLRRAGADAIVFSYRPRHVPIARNAEALGALVARLRAPTIHLVGHSLGGLVVNRMLRDCPDPRPGRVVFMGTPYQGSAVARRLNRLGLGRWLCGMSLREALLGEGARWPGGRELGIIAGTAQLGAGRWITHLTVPHDGTVTVAETRVPEAKDMVTLPVTHTGLLHSAAVARQVIAFLAEGRFSRSGEG